MKPKRHVKPNKKSGAATHILLASVLAALILLLSALLFLLKQDQPGSTNETPPSTSRQLFSAAAEDVVSITITPPKGEQYTLQCKNGVFYLPEDGDFTVRDTLAETILLNVCHIYIEDTILNTQETVVDLEHFGLSPARCTAAIQYQDGTVHTLHIGDQMQLGIPYRYFMWDDDPNLYAVSNDTYEAFSYTLSALRSVEQPVWDSTLWDRVSITGENVRTLEETDAGWVLTQPYAYPLSADAVSNYLSSVENIRFAEFVGYSDKLDLSLYDLDSPRLTLTLHQTPTTVSFLNDAGEETSSLLLPEEEIVLHIGSDVDEYYFYAEYLGTVYTATRFQLGFLFDQDLSFLLDSTPLDVPITALQTLTVEDETGHAAYSIHLTEQLTQTGELKTDELGNQLFDVSVQRSQTAFDTATFLNWYAELQKLELNAKAADQFTPSSYDRQLTFETAECTRTVAFSRYDALHTAVTVDGTTLFYTPNAAVDNLFPCP